MDTDQQKYINFDAQDAWYAANKAIERQNHHGFADTPYFIGHQFLGYVKKIARRISHFL